MATRSGSGVQQRPPPPPRRRRRQQLQRLCLAAAVASASLQAASGQEPAGWLGRTTGQTPECSLALVAPSWVLAAADCVGEAGVGRARFGEAEVAATATYPLGQGSLFVLAKLSSPLDALSPAPLAPLDEGQALASSAAARPEPRAVRLSGEAAGCGADPQDLASVCIEAVGGTCADGMEGALVQGSAVVGIALPPAACATAGAAVLRREGLTLLNRFIGIGDGPVLAPPASNPDAPASTGTSPGLIAGLATAGAAGVLMAFAALAWKQQRRQQHEQQQQMQMHGHPDKAFGGAGGSGGGRPGSAEGGHPQGKSRRFSRRSGGSNQSHKSQQQELYGVGPPPQAAAVEARMPNNWRPFSTGSQLAPPALPALGPSESAAQNARPPPPPPPLPPSRESEAEAPASDLESSDGSHHDRYVDSDSDGHRSDEEADWGRGPGGAPPTPPPPAPSQPKASLPIMFNKHISHLV